MDGLHHIVKFSTNYFAKYAYGVFYTHNKKKTANILEIVDFTRMCIYYLNMRVSEIVATCLYSVMLYLLTLPLSLCDI